MDNSQREGWVFVLRGVHEAEVHASSQTPFLVLLLFSSPCSLYFYFALSQSPGSRERGGCRPASTLCPYTSARRLSTDTPAPYSLAFGLHTPATLPQLLLGCVGWVQSGGRDGPLTP